MEYAVVLVAALFHAVWNSIVKSSPDKLLTLAAIRTVGLGAGLIVICTSPLPGVEILPCLVGAVIVLFFYYWFLLNTYRVGDFSQVYPISRGVAPVIVLFGSMVFAGEFLSVSQVSGILLVSLGIGLLVFSKGRITLRPLLYALGTGCCIAGYTVLCGLGVRATGSFLVFCGWLEVITGLTVVGCATVKRKRAVVVFAREHGLKGLLAGILSVSGFAAAVWAMETVAMAPVAALRETSIVFAALIGAFTLKEKFAFSRISAAILVAGGVVVLVF